MSSASAITIKVDDRDNVAVVVNPGGLPAGSRLEDGSVLLSEVPQGHKVALCDIPCNQAVIRYGEVIGQALQDIPRGSWVK